MYNKLLAEFKFLDGFKYINVKKICFNNKYTLLSETISIQWLSSDKILRAYKRILQNEIFFSIFKLKCFKLAYFLIDALYL